jgi:hypothetical protein
MRCPRRVIVFPFLPAMNSSSVGAALATGNLGMDAADRVGVEPTSPGQGKQRDINPLGLTDAQPIRYLKC